MFLKRMFSSLSGPRSSGGGGTGVLMLNMGGPRSGEEVQDFLTRLFLDRDIIRLPWQSKLGPLIARRRAPSIAEKYAEIGGGSPIYRWTTRQGELLCQTLDQRCPDTAPHRPYVGFRYAQPLAEDALDLALRDGLRRLVLFSQYPQYSCTTAGSSLNQVYRHLTAAAKGDERRGSSWPELSVIDRWPTNRKLAATFADNIRRTLDEAFTADQRGQVVLLFSAHSVPQYVANRGDPYPAEVGATVSLVMEELGWSNPYRLVWQSKVGPLPWLEPGTEKTIEALVERGQKDLLLVPIAFVNEHIETLHELDLEYARDLGAKVGARKIARCPAPNDHPLFIEAMADVVAQHLQQGPRVSPQLLLRCPMCTNPTCGEAKQWFSSTCTGQGRI